MPADLQLCNRLVILPHGKVVYGGKVRGTKYGSEVPIYQIRIRGRLDPARSAWFGSLLISYEGDFTLMTGELQDQPALFGLLKANCQILYHQAG